VQIAGRYKSFGRVDVLTRIDPAIGRSEKLTLIGLAARRTPHYRRAPPAFGAAVVGLDASSQARRS
jgi:hypothetical protein